MVTVFCVSEPDNAVVPKKCSADRKESATGPQEIRGYISAMATLKFIYYLNESIYVFSKII